MPFYAQLDGSVVVGISDLHSDVNSDHMIPIDLMDPSLIGKTWDSSKFVSPAALSAPVVVVTAISVDQDHAALSNVVGVNEVTCPAGATVTVIAEIRDSNGHALPVSDSFRMPIRASDGREKVLLAVASSGRITISVPLRESGIWSVTEEAMNEHMPAGEYLRFAGIRAFVVDQ